MAAANSGGGGSGGNTNATRQRFVVGFTVHEAKELSRDGTAVDPLCVVRALGREYKTELKRGKRQHVKFNESFIWSDIYLTEEEFNVAFIDFELQAANVWTRNDIIGTARVQLAMVRRRPNHTSAQKWLQLSNNVSTSAQLKATVFCYGQGEDPPRPEDLENDQEETNKHMEGLGNALVGDGTGMKPQDTQAYHLFVQVHRAEHLGGGEKKLNPYVTVEFNGHRLESPPARDTHTIMFDECFRLPVVLPLMADSVIIRIWDKKKFQADSIIVQGRLSFSLLRMHALQPKWFNFYGFSEKEVNDIHALTSQGEPAEENVYMGRLLISGRVTKVPKPSNLLKAGIIKGQIAEEPPASSMTFALDVVEISGCPGMEVYAEMSLGTRSKASKPVQRSDYDENPDFATPGRFRYTPGEGRVPPLTMVVPTDPTNQLDVIISIYSSLQQAVGRKVERVGFVRLKVAHIKEWRGETATPFWVACSPMAHLPSSIEPGALLISLAKSSTQIKNRGVANVRPLHFELRCYIFMARDLVSQTREVPNPFCQVSCAGSIERTRTIPSTTAPSWGALLKVPIELQCSLETQRVQPEPVQIVLYDEVEDVLEGLKDKTAKAVKEGDLTYLSASNFDKLGAMGGQALSDLQDQLGGLTGDILAKKRLGAVVNGRRVIGRAKVNLRSIIRPSSNQGPFHPRWVRLKGGIVGGAGVGAILLGVEMMKRKYANQIPVQPTVPQCKPCTISVSILGLRDISAIHGRPVMNPKLQVVIPSLTGEQAMMHTIDWSSKPIQPLSPDDTNRRWTNNGQTGFDFLNVIHLNAVLPRYPVWEPNIRFRLLDGDDKDAFLAEGRVSLVEHIPWIKPGRGKQAVEAYDDLDDGNVDGSAKKDDGIQVSDAEDEGSASYITSAFSEGSIDVGFSRGDTKTFPPIVSHLEEKAHNGDLRRGDWLVAVTMPGDKAERPVAHWSPAQAAKWVADCTKNQTKPVTMRFRRTDKAEVFVRLLQGQPTGLELADDINAKPPRISKDVSSEKLWKRQGVGTGWRIVDINGFDTKGMNSQDPQFQELLKKRPSIVTCRPHGVGTGVMEELNIQLSKPVMLSGVPSRVHKEFEHMMRHKDGCMALMTTPRPSLVLPSVTETKQLNMYLARAACMDVRGVVRHIIKGNEDSDDMRTRPSVAGRLEDNMEASIFSKVELKNGPQSVGHLKICYRVVSPADKEWVQKLEDPSHPDKFLFDPILFRKRHRQDQPYQFRVRTYVIRGLNVSGAKFGYGNPYLFFKYGQDKVMLEGHRQLNTVEPRFFKTQEMDIHLPEQAHFEVGLYDWQDHEGEHAMIGKSAIDLEERWYTPTFQAYMRQNKVPIEYRPVNQEMEGGVQICKGSLEMWMEILDATHAAEVPANPLQQPPAVEVEIRAIVYTVRNLSLRLCVDDETGEERERVTIRVRCSLDCRTYYGSQQREQETDLHHGSEGNGEFNWRFIFSRVAVTQGVPLDCFLQFSIWEHFDIASPKMLCENLVEMKNYCKKVAKHSEELDMEAELPLQNSQLAKLLDEETPGEDGYDDNDSGSEDDASVDEQAPLQDEKGHRKKEIPPAGMMKVLVQVFPQTQASSSDMVSGLGRSEPNRNPILSFPTTGRSWEAILPGTAKVVQDVLNVVSTGKRRCACMSIAVSIVFIIGLLHFIKNPSTGCPYIQKSCKDQNVCKLCSICHHRDKPPASFCYYGFMGSADKICLGSAYRNFCNYNPSTTDQFCHTDESHCSAKDLCGITPNGNDGNAMRDCRPQNSPGAVPGPLVGPGPVPGPGPGPLPGPAPGPGPLSR